MKSSSYSGFYKLSADARLKEVAEFSNMSAEDQVAVGSGDALSMDTADLMIENVIGRFALPIGVATNFVINGKDYLIPMVCEEASVVAACSNAAKMARAAGGFRASSTGSVMIAQIQLLNVPAPFHARCAIFENKDEIIRKCNEKDPVLVGLGGGMRDVEVRVISTSAGPMVIVHLLVDTLDAMGANAVNTMAESVAPFLEKITGGFAELRILSNLADRRLVRVRAVFKKDAIGGADVVDKIVRAYAFAEADPYRAATNNKGIMNGVTPVVLATGNDTRAIEAGAHSYASRTGKYSPLAVWEKDGAGDLTGTLEMPMAVGLVGGATKIHPTAQALLRVLRVKSAAELGQVIGAAGLANNMTALKALATEGIQRGHMSLHARNIAATAGATGELLEKIVEEMVSNNNVRLEYAQQLLRDIRGEGGETSCP